MTQEEIRALPVGALLSITLNDGVRFPYLVIGKKEDDVWVSYTSSGMLRFNLTHASPVSWTDVKRIA